MLARSNLSPSDFYEQYFTEIGQPGEKIEVDGISPHIMAAAKKP